jgi:hypothetical protein
MNQKQLRLTLIIGFVVIAAAIVGIIAFITNGGSTLTSNEPTVTEYHDPGSGDTVIDVEGKTPETYGSNPDAPGFLGITELASRGMSDGDIDAIEAFWNDYANKQITENKEKITEISLTKDSIQHSVDRDTAESIYTMDFVINRNTGYVLTVTSEVSTKTSYALYKGIDTSTPPVYTKGV